MKRFALILFSASGFLFFSCSKDDTSSIVNTPPPAGTDSNYLSKVFIIDSTTAAGEDTLETLSYYYDNEHRVINVRDSFINAGIRSDFMSSTYYYNGSDTIPYKTHRTYTDGGVYDTTTKFFYYDASGRRIKDSSFISGINTSGHYVRNIVSTYQYLPGKIYGYSRDTSIYPVSSFPSRTTTDTATLDANNYITSSIKHYLGSTVQSVITNTNSKNAYYGLSIRSCFDVFPNGYGTYNNFATSNNPSHITDIHSGSGGGTFETDNSYIFNNSGYLKQVTVTDLTIPGQYYKSVLFYGTL